MSIKSSNHIKTHKKSVPVLKVLIMMIIIKNPRVIIAVRALTGHGGNHYGVQGVIVKPEFSTNRKTNREESNQSSAWPLKTFLAREPSVSIYRLKTKVGGAPSLYNGGDEQPRNEDDGEVKC